MSSKEQGSERRAKFFSSREAVGYLLKNGVPKSRRALKALVAVGTGKPDGEVSQELMDSLSFVNYEVHPQQINVRDKANGKIIASIRK